MTSSIRSQLAPAVLRHLRRSGLDPRPLAHAFGLQESAETTPELVLPLHRYYAFLDAAERASGDRWLGLHVAQQHERGTYGLLEFAMRSAPTVREGLARLVRHASLLNEVVSVELAEVDDTAIIREWIPGVPRCFGRHGNEHAMALLVVEARKVLDPAFRPRRVWFAHPAPPDRGELEQSLGTTALEFDRDGNGLAFDRDVLARGFSSADPELLAFLDREAERRLVVPTDDGDLVADVRRGVRAQLADGPPSIDSVARGLASSRRTLQRRLSDAGVTFRGVVDEARAALAREYVAERARPLGEIAFLLGYAELRPFLRAFKRWTGSTPTQYRAR